MIEPDVTMKKTAILGASNNPYRYAFRAAEMLQEYGHEIVPVGIKRGEVGGEEILDIKLLHSSFSCSQLAQQKGIATLNACTLVMLTIGQY